MCGTSRMQFQPIIWSRDWTRLKLPPVVWSSSRIMSSEQGLVNQSAVTDSQLPSRVALISSDNAMEALTTTNEASLASIGREGRSTISVAQSSHQTVLPMVIDGTHVRQLLRNWRLIMIATWITANVSALRDDGGLAASPETSQSCHGVLDNMIDVVNEATHMFTQPSTNATVSIADRAVSLLLLSKKVEMVAMILNPASSAHIQPAMLDASVQSLCVLSRQKIKDDSSGSIGRLLEEHHGYEWGFPWTLAQKQFDVFAIEGLVSRPGLDEQSARELLAKIQSYAWKEQNIVVLSRNAHLNEGKDLTDYYVRLGFEIVMMDNGLQELVYLGGSSADEDVLAENEQIMVGINMLTVT